MKEVAQRRRLKPCRMEATGFGIPALHYHANAIADTRVARRAVNIESLLSTLEHLHRHRKGHPVAFFSIDQTRIEVFILMQLVPRNRVRHLRTHRPAIGIKARSALRKELRFVLHVLAATSQKPHPGKSPNRDEFIELLHATSNSLFSISSG